MAIEALLIGMTSPAHVREEIAGNLEVLLLLIFMVAGIHFMKQLLLFVSRACCGDPQQDRCRWPSAWRPPSSPPFSMRLPWWRW